MEDFERFYRNHVRLVLAMAASRLAVAAVAEEVTQETFLRAWQHYAHVAALPPAAQKAWLVRTMRNLATDLWRRQMLEDNLPPVEAAPTTSPELRLDVAQALAELTSEERELVVMRYVEGMNSREIGEALEVPEGTVRRRLSDCRSKLAERLRQWAPEVAEA